ncbi:MAG: RNA polymerase subunit sigma-70 [Halobacteriovoraceae bacterium]|nr:RNA polymerase subunit sigma-70 [Halobacteriovoraceae bacterium]|tara:strand:- start:2327 stop:3349 length:1023 start_codon:yes stop_codon:yes gene_type:complete
MAMTKDKKKSISPEVLDADIKENKQKEKPKDDIIDISNISKSDLEIIQEILPVKAQDFTPTRADDLDPLKQYLREITKYKLLSIEEEQELTKQLSETGDIEVAKKLVMANLRLVVKIAMEYRSAYKNVMDLIQEGNMGLMKAVSKYNPDKGAKLSYYASWWIKSYILKFILDNFRLIKIGTTAEQKKLFYNLMREKERLQNQGIEPETKLLSENLGVSEKAVEVMNLRLSSEGQEVSFDTPLGEDNSTTTLGDNLDSDELGIDEQLGELQSLQILEENLENFIQDLKPRDQEIFKKRLLSEVPPSLQSIADEYGVSRERIRQIEARLLEKLKVYMSEFIR